MGVPQCTEASTSNQQHEMMASCHCMHSVELAAACGWAPCAFRTKAIKLVSGCRCTDSNTRKETLGDSEQLKNERTIVNVGSDRLLVRNDQAEHSASHLHSISREPAPQTATSTLEDHCVHMKVAWCQVDKENQALRVSRSVVNNEQSLVLALRADLKAMHATVSKLRLTCDEQRRRATNRQKVLLKITERQAIRIRELTDTLRAIESLHVVKGITADARASCDKPAMSCSAIQRTAMPAPDKELNPKPRATANADCPQIRSFMRPETCRTTHCLGSRSFALRQRIGTEESACDDSGDKHEQPPSMYGRGGINPDFLGTHPACDQAHHQNCRMMHLESEHKLQWHTYGNGTKERIWPTTGRRDMVYQNGTTKTITHDTVVIKFSNNDVKITNITTGKVIYHYASAATTHTTDPRLGVDIFEFANGQVEEQWKGGARCIRYPDGTNKLIQPM